jgi:CHAD domain-containing protein
MSNGSASLTTREFLGEAVRTAAAEVEETAAAALADEPDGVHQHRVRVRRLRSVLAGFRDRLDRETADGMRARFAEWGGELGAVRDMEVRADVAEQELADAGIDDPDMVRRLVAGDRRAHARAHARLVALAATPEAAERRNTLAALAAASVTGTSDEKAAPFIAAVLAAQARRVRKAAGRIDGSEESYHAVRKSARRLRYVAEAVARSAPGLYETQVEELAGVGEALHDALGGHRDAVLFADHVARESVLAARAGEWIEAYPAIEASARAAAAERLAELPHALHRLRRAASDLR